MRVLGLFAAACRRSEGNGIGNADDDPAINARDSLTGRRMLPTSRVVAST